MKTQAYAIFTKSISTIIVFISIALSSHTYANTNESSFFNPYKAVYSTIWKKGISLKVKGEQTLTKKKNGEWSFIFSADSMLASLKEMSSFQVRSHQIIPSHYKYNTSALGKKRSAELTFNWEKSLVKNNIKNKPWNLAINPGTLDKLSVQLQIRQDLKINKEDLNYQVADGGYIKDWRFKRSKLETIETKLGTLSTVKVIRTDNLKKGKKTSLWFAPELDYLLVKLEHKEDGESYQLNVDSIKQL